MASPLQIDQAYIQIYNAYIYIKTNLVFEALYSIIGGIILTTFVFKLIGIIKEMISEGKGFNAKHFFELGKEYIFCIGIICILPVFIALIEQLFAYTAEHFTSGLVTNGVYNHDNIWLEPISNMLDELNNNSIVDIAVSGLDTLSKSFFAAVIGSFFGCAYNYIMFVFVCTRYMMLILLEVIAPIAIVCLYNGDTRNSFYTWLKNMFACYMLYPGFIIASVFSDQIVTNYVLNTSWSVVVMVIFSFILKLSLLNIVRTTINKWL